MAGLARTDDVRRQNTRLIMRVLRRQQQASRTDIVKQTGLSAATVSTITSSLINEGILLIHDESTTSLDTVAKRGRPRVTLSLNPQVGCIVVMVMSMNRLSACLQDYAGQTLARIDDHFSSRTASAEDFEYYLSRMVTRLLCKQNGVPAPLRYITLGVQGVVDAVGQNMLWSPITKLINLPLGEMLHQAFQVPVWVANDCNMVAEALRWMEPERFGEDFGAILLGSGIGMGLMLKGKRFIGTQSSAAEFGHMVYMPHGAMCRCGQVGCIEAYAGDYAVWRRVHQLPLDSEPVDEVDISEIIARAHEEAGAEREAYREAGQALGHGLRSLFALIDPVNIAFVGQGVRSFDLMEGAIREALRHNGSMLAANDISFYCYEDSEALIHLGCAINALQTIDNSAGII